MFLLLTCVWITNWTTRGQGTISFYNNGLQDPNTGQVYNARVTLPDGTPVTGDAFTAGLFLVGSGGLDLVDTTTFRPPPSMGIFVPKLMTVPGVPSGFPASFRVRVWETDAGSYENAVAQGKYYGEFKTADPQGTLHVDYLGYPLGQGPNALTPPTLTGIQPLTLVPEPGSVGLVLLGAGLFGTAGLIRQRAVSKDLKTLPKHS